MSLDPVIPSDIHRSGFEFCFHDSEIFFNFPALLVNLYDFLNISLQICHNCVETIVKFFLGYLFLINLIPIITQELFDAAHANSKKCIRSKRGKRNYNPFYYCGVCGRALAPSKRVKGDILLCYSSRIEENSPCKNNRVEIAKVEDAIMKTVNMYAAAYLDEKGIKKAGKSKEVSPEEKVAALEKKVKSLSSKKMMLYSDYKDDKLTREEYVKRSKAMVEQIDELHQEIEQLKTEIPPEDNSSSKFETQLESIINMESFDREKIRKVIKKVIINGADNIEIVWNTDDPFFK